MNARTQRARQMAAAAVAHAQDRADSWGSPYPPRRPRNGHVADCPRWGDPNPCKCRHCRAERLEPVRRPTTAPAGTASAGERLHELVACAGCYTPTDHPTGRCPNCREA